MSNLLRKLKMDLETAGLVGERSNALIVFLVALSARLSNPLNLTICGESASGKNHLMAMGTLFIPDEHKRSLTGMSPKVLMHSAVDEYKHKAILIAEHEGVSGADYPIRSFQSEKKIVWEYVDTASKDGIKKRTNTVDGPAAFIQATTRVSLHRENETRQLSIQIDESAEQTQAIMNYQARKAAGKTQPFPPEILSEWQTLLRNLETADVRILFAEQLAAGMPLRIRSRRDFPKLLGLIEASAYLHQQFRARDKGCILASPQDYQIAHELFQSCYHSAVERNVSDFLRAFGSLDTGGEFKVADMTTRLRWGHTKCYQILERLKDLGQVADTPLKRGFYTLISRDPEPALDLPKKPKLNATDFRISAQLPPQSFEQRSEG